jgi:hypothetical protein
MVLALASDTLAPLRRRTRPYFRIGLVRPSLKVNLGSNPATEELFSLLCYQWTTIVTGFLALFSTMGPDWINEAYEMV